MIKGRLASAIVDSLSRRYQAKLLAKLASVLGVSTVTLAGNNGVFEGRPDDFGLFFHYIERRMWSSGTVATICTLFDRLGGGTFVDIGANIGLTAVPVAMLPGTKVIAIEADPDNYALLCSNLRRNGCETNASALHVAVGSEPGTFALVRNPTNSGDRRVRGPGQPSQDYEGGWESVEVVVRTLDDIMQQISGVAAVAESGAMVAKMDIQGAEVRALRSGQVTFGQADALFTEFWPAGIRRFGDRPDEYLNDLLHLFPYICEYDEDSGAIRWHTRETLAPLLHLADDRPVADGKWVRTDYRNLIACRERVRAML